MCAQLPWENAVAYSYSQHFPERKSQGAIPSPGPCPTPFSTSSRHAILFRLWPESIYLHSPFHSLWDTRHNSWERLESRGHRWFSLAKHTVTQGWRLRYLPATIQKIPSVIFDLLDMTYSWLYRTPIAPLIAHRIRELWSNCMFARRAIPRTFPFLYWREALVNGVFHWFGSVVHLSVHTY